MLKIKLKQVLTEIYDKYLFIISFLFRGWIWKQLESTPIQYKCLHISTVNFCNALCVFCGQHKFERPKLSLSLESYKKLIKESFDYGIRHIDFTPTLGDPLLDPLFKERVILAREMGYEKLDITTNGIKFVEPGLVEFVLRYIDLIRISIGGLDAETYKKAYKVNSFEKVWYGLQRLIMLNSDRIINQRRIHIFFRTGIDPKEIFNNIKFKWLKSFSNVTYEFTNLYDNWGGSVKKEDLVGEMKMRSEKKKSGVPCIAIKEFWVEPQGNVRLCGCRFNGVEEDDLVIGNVKKEELKDILLHERVLKLARRFKTTETLPDICKDCSLYRPIT